MAQSTVSLVNLDCTILKNVIRQSVQDILRKYLDLFQWLGKINGLFCSLNWAESETNYCGNWL
jgi:hypothetical protein